MSSDQCYDDVMNIIFMSQSLWNRAVSSDKIASQLGEGESRLNPFGTGQCLPTVQCCERVNGQVSQSLWNRAVSSDNGKFSFNLISSFSLNPFGTGQCLPTIITSVTTSISAVSIPLEQGSVFRRKTKQGRESARVCLNPFGTGQCLPTAVVF